MAAKSQTALLAALKQSTAPDEKRDLALALLDVSMSRQNVDEALHALRKAHLTEEHRPIIRKKALFYFEQDDKDSGGLLREDLMKLLTQIGNPADEVIYRRGVMVYELKPVIDTAYTCRSAALIGLAGCDSTLATVHATRLLGEEHTSPLSGEPSLTALAVLARFNETLPIYAFILRQGEAFVRRANTEVVGKAFELLGADFPSEVFAAAAEPFIAMDAPATSAGIINAIIENRSDALYPLLNRILDETRDDDLHYYGLVTLAAARDDGLSELLYQRARTCSSGDVKLYMEAVELTAHPDRDAALDMLEKRL